MSFIPSSLLTDPVVAQTHDYGLDPIDTETLISAKAVGDGGVDPEALRRQACAILVMCGASIADTLENRADFFDRVFVPAANRLADAMKTHEAGLPEPAAAETCEDEDIRRIQYHVAELWRYLRIAKGAHTDLAGSNLSGVELWAELTAYAQLLTQRAWCLEALDELTHLTGLPGIDGYGRETRQRVLEVMDICGLSNAS